MQWYGVAFYHCPDGSRQWSPRSQRPCEVAVVERDADGKREMVVREKGDGGQELVRTELSRRTNFKKLTADFFSFQIEKIVFGAKLAAAAEAPACLQQIEEGVAWNAAQQPASPGVLSPSSSMHQIQGNESTDAGASSGPHRPEAQQPPQQGQQPPQQEQQPPQQAQQPSQQEQQPPQQAQQPPQQSTQQEQGQSSSAARDQTAESAPQSGGGDQEAQAPAAAQHAQSQGQAPVAAVKRNQLAGELLETSVGADAQLRKFQPLSAQQQQGSSSTSAPPVYVPSREEVLALESDSDEDNTSCDSDVESDPPTEVTGGGEGLSPKSFGLIALSEQHPYAHDLGFLQRIRQAQHNLDRDLAHLFVSSAFKLQTAKTFEQADVNADGFLSGEELQLVLRSLVLGLRQYDLSVEVKVPGRRRTARILKDMDQNGDGKLSLEEFQKLAREFTRWSSMVAQIPDLTAEYTEELRRQARELQERKAREQQQQEQLQPQAQAGGGPAVDRRSHRNSMAGIGASSLLQALEDGGTASNRSSISSLRGLTRRAVAKAERREARTSLSQQQQEQQQQVQGESQEKSLEHSVSPSSGVVASAGEGTAAGTGTVEGGEGRIVGQDGGHDDTLSSSSSEGEEEKPAETASASQGGRQVQEVVPRTPVTEVPADLGLLSLRQLEEMNEMRSNLEKDAEILRLKGKLMLAQETASRLENELALTRKSTDVREEELLGEVARQRARLEELEERSRATVHKSQLGTAVASLDLENLRSEMRRLSDHLQEMDGQLIRWKGEVVRQCMLLQEVKKRDREEIRQLQEHRDALELEKWKLCKALEKSQRRASAAERSVEKLELEIVKTVTEGRNSQMELELDRANLKRKLVAKESELKLYQALVDNPPEESLSQFNPTSVSAITNEWIQVLHSKNKEVAHLSDELFALRKQLSLAGASAVAAAHMTAHARRLAAEQSGLSPRRRDSWSSSGTSGQSSPCAAISVEAEAPRQQGDSSPVTTPVAASSPRSRTVRGDTHASASGSSAATDDTPRNRFQDVKPSPRTMLQASQADFASAFEASGSAAVPHLSPQGSFNHSSKTSSALPSTKAMGYNFMDMMDSLQSPRKESVS